MWPCPCWAMLGQGAVRRSASSGCQVAGRQPSHRHCRKVFGGIRTICCLWMQPYMSPGARLQANVPSAWQSPDRPYYKGFRRRGLESYWQVASSPGALSHCCYGAQTAMLCVLVPNSLGTKVGPGPADATMQLSFHCVHGVICRCGGMRESRPPAVCYTDKGREEGSTTHKHAHHASRQCQYRMIHGRTNLNLGKHAPAAH